VKLGFDSFETILAVTVAGRRICPAPYQRICLVVADGDLAAGPQRERDLNPIPD
jgi:hypothetical protein